MKIGNIEPYPFQDNLISSITKEIRAQWASGNKFKPVFVEAYVSAGKTIVIGAIANRCAQVGGKCLVLARIGELVSQNSDECWNMDTKNSVFSASLGIKSTHFNVVVGTEGTIANHLDREFASDGWRPNIILIDECHTVDWRDALNETPTSQYGKILKHFMDMNPKTAVIGLTGTPYRGLESILGDFWDKRLDPVIGRKYLVDNSYIVPTIFGYAHDDVGYDLSDFTPKSHGGTADFSSSELEAMSEKMDLTVTHKIMSEVMAITSQRNGVLVTCASEKHCKEAAEVLPANSFGIVTQSTGKKERKLILDGARDGSIKYVLQIGCLTTGVNIPLWDTSVVLRRIGSLTLLTQLLGRGMRLLKPEQVAAGITKIDHLCLDYAGTMAAMQQMFDDPFLEQAELERAKREFELKTCPVCETMNSEHARRCIGADVTTTLRCEFFWQSKECPHCQAQNDVTARQCRCCSGTLIDPNEALSGKHYSDDDWKRVLKMDLQPTGNGGIYVKLHLDAFTLKGEPEVAKMFFNPWASAGAKRVYQHQFVNRFCGWGFARKVLALPNAEAVCNMKAMFDVPEFVTHRINERKQSVVHGIKFKSRTTMGGKKV